MHSIRSTMRGCFKSATSASLARDTRGDIMDVVALTAALAAAKPEIVFHLAAQSLVRRSYSDPVETVATNVLGTVHVLHALRSIEGVRAALIITTDKCYRNIGRLHPYRETDVLGGHDPYAASKACVELLVASFRTSFFTSSDRLANYFLGFGAGRQCHRRRRLG